MAVTAPIQANAGVQVNPPARAFNDSISLTTTEVDSEGSTLQGSSQPSTPRSELDLGVLWMPNSGDMEFASRVAYASINIDAPTDSPAPFIHAAVFSVASDVHYRMFPSSQGDMMLVFDSSIERDMVVSPLQLRPRRGRRPTVRLAVPLVMTVPPPAPRSPRRLLCCRARLGVLHSAPVPDSRLGTRATSWT